MNPKTEKEFKRLKNLKQNKNKSDEELQKLYTDAQINVAKREVKADDRFTAENEKSIAIELFEHYVRTYEFEKYTDLCTLQSLIYEEILLRRIQNHINKTFTNDGNTYLDKRERETLTETEKRIEEFKIKLGIDKEDAEINELSALQLLAQRFDKYINANKHEFTIVCYNCQKLLLIRKRVKDFDCIEHPWFAGRWFFNYQILLDVKEGKITKQQAWRYMCSAAKGETERPAFSKEYCEDYIKYCLENWDDITENLK